VAELTAKSKRAGLSPGTLIHVGRARTERARIRVIDYAENKLEEKELATIEECFPYRDKPTVTWINVDGVHQIEIIEKIGKHFGLHPLILEDIVNTHQRPKCDDYDDHLFIVLKMLGYDEARGEVSSEQVSLVLGKNYVISFQETEGDVFDPVRERIRGGKGRIRKMGADYLAYALIDAIVDHYFIILEKLGERIETLEEEMVTDPDVDTLTRTHKLKRQMLVLRKCVWPLREVVSRLERGESTLIRKPTHVFLRDVYDHTIQVIDTIETDRDMLSGLLDLYLSTVSNKMNAVMKVLTIIATIFIPLTFIAGIYGMNFEFMPELHWHWGYPIALLIMLAVGVIMLLFFRKRKWL
jgi:magnesium transporter